MKKIKKGFSLVELIVVIALIALLSAGAVLAFNGVQANARRATLQTEAQMLADALNRFNQSGRGTVEGAPATTVHTLTLSSTFTTAPRIVSMNGQPNDTNINLSVNAGTAPTYLNLRIPPIGPLGAQYFRVDFETRENFRRALQALDYASGRFTVNNTRIQNWNGRHANLNNNP